MGANLLHGEDGENEGRWAVGTINFLTGEDFWMMTGLSIIYLFQCKPNFVCKKTNVERVDVPLGEKIIYPVIWIKQRWWSSEAFWNHIYGRLSVLIPLIIFDITTVAKSSVVETLYKAKSHPSNYSTASFTCLIISISGSKFSERSSCKTAIGERLGMCLLRSTNNRSCNRVNLHPVQHASHFRNPEWCHMLSIFLFTVSLPWRIKHLSSWEVWEEHQVFNW